MTSTAAPALATATLTDTELRNTLERYRTSAEKTLAEAREKIAEEATISYAAGWHIGPAVKAETELEIYTRALRAPVERTRAALTQAVAENLNASGRSTDPWSNAVDGARNDAARLVLRFLGSELDAQLLVELMF